MFFGDDSPLNVSSIRLIETGVNLESHIAAITALDCIISGSLWPDNAISEDSTHGTVIKNLFDRNDGLKSSTTKIKFSPYIYQSFQCFIAHKTKVKIDIDDVDGYLEDKELLELLFYDLVRKVDIEEDVTDNVIKPRLFQVLKNVKEVTINAYDYPFSLIEFLSTIANTSINKVIIKTYVKTCSSLKASSDFEIIKAKYKAQQFDIAVDGHEIKIDHFVVL